MKEEERDLKLKKVMTYNKSWPLIVVGAPEEKVIEDKEEALIISAEMEERLLREGKWLKLMSGKSQLVIEKMDEAEIEEQEHFVGLLKDRRVGNKKVDEDIQIIIPVRSETALSPLITALSLVWRY